MFYTNPVHPGYFADPFVWRHDRDYCAIGTGRGEAVGLRDDGPEPSVFPLLVSDDLVQWREAGHALVRPERSLGDTFWAPEIVQADGEWFLYYSVGHDDRGHQLRVARSPRMLGPYRDCAQLTDPEVVPFAIDPHPFRDADGRWYLFHARDFLDTEGASVRAVRAGTALAVFPLRSMTEPEHERLVTVARARFDWQRFRANRRMYGGVYDWHTLEGPFVLRHAGRYYCLYSGGCWQDDSYGVDYVVAQNVLGPYSDSGADAGPRVLQTVPQRVLGPGHCSVTLAAGAATRYIAYHAWDPDRTARRLCIDPLELTAEGPRSPGPTWTPQPLATVPSCP